VVHLPCAPASVSHARRALSDELTAAGVCARAVGDAALVVSELVSNAILHAYPLPGERLKVAWVLDDGWVEVAVSDGGSATMPQAGHPTAAAVSGRGLAIVAHVCQTWGVRTDDVGLTVWAILPAPDSEQAPGPAELQQPVESAATFGFTPPVQAVPGLKAASS
jgi:anti-sigma regulatory factor (Ser/Thr protein kinase)